MNLSINESLFNLVQIFKQLLLLEQHLSIPKMMCERCVLKHIMTIISYSDEMISLGVYNKDINKYLQVQKRCYTLKLLLKHPRSFDYNIILLRSVRSFRKNLEPIVYKYITN